MNIEIYTERAKGFVQSAQSLALREGHQQFSSEHLLKVLLDDAEGLAAGLIGKSGGRQAQALAAVEQSLARRPKVSGGGAGQIALSDFGSVLVVGVFDTGDVARGGHGQNLALGVFSPDDGTYRDPLPAENTGPAVGGSGLGGNRLGDVVLGGTLQQPDGNSKAIFVKYDRAGNLVRNWSYPLPSGYRSSNVQVTGIDNGAEVEFLGQITRGNAFAMHIDSAIVCGAFSPDGSLARQALYRARPGRPTRANSETSAFQNYRAVVGQAGLGNDHMGFLVLLY